MEQENKSLVYYKIDKNFSGNFDVLQNIKVSNRKSSQWFSDDNKLMLEMRDWTSQYWNTQTWWVWTSWLYFFTDFQRKRHRIKWYNNKVWRLNSSDNIWIDIWGTFTWNDFYFNTVKIPHMVTDTVPTEYTTPSNSSMSELVIKSASDTNPTSNIWKVILITDNSWDNQSFQWCFWYITRYDATTTEYIIWNSWILWSLDSTNNVIWIKAWSKYRIYDTLWEHLQVSNWVDLDRYFYWKTDWTIVENTAVAWFVTYWLRRVKALTATQYLKKQVNYNNSYFAFSKWTLFYSAWAINNPFFYTFMNALTIPWIKWGDINDIFIFKKRLIIAWTNFVRYLPWFSDLIQVDIISDSYWMVEKSLIDAWVDAYFITSDKQIYSLSETITWTLLATNVWKPVNNYIKNYNTKISAWFNWRQLFYYWQIDSSTAWIMIVLDLQYKFWSIYTWLRPSSIVSENWVTYFSDNNSSIIRYLDSTKTDDIWVEIEQKIAFSEIVYNDVFTVKTLSDIYAWFDNYNQDIYIDVYMAWFNNNWRKARYEMQLLETATNESIIWEEVLWEWLLWWEVYESNISFPFVKHIAFDSDSANIWKIIITWKNWSPFYLNEFAVRIGTDNDQKVYFSAEDTM